MKNEKKKKEKGRKVNESWRFRKPHALAFESAKLCEDILNAKYLKQEMISECECENNRT
jgi:hypothetical protein